MSNKIEITWLYDEVECDHTGCSGGWDNGAVVKLNGEVIISHIPSASCFGGVTNKEVTDIYEEILKKLGYQLDETSLTADEYNAN